MRKLMLAALLGAAFSTSPAAAALVGFDLTIADEGGTTSTLDNPFFTLSNTSVSADLLTFTLTLGSGSTFNIDRVYNFSAVNPTAPSLTVTDQSPNQTDGGVRAGSLSLTYTGFNARDPNEGSKFLVEFDEGNANTTTDFRTILFNNGATGNAVATATFSDGQTVSLTLPDAPGTTASSFTFSATSATAVPEPAAWAMMISGFGLVGGVLRSRRSTLAIA